MLLFEVALLSAMFIVRVGVPLLIIIAFGTVIERAYQRRSHA